MQTMTKHQKRSAAGDSEGEIRAAPLPKGDVWRAPAPHQLHAGAFLLGLSLSHTALKLTMELRMTLTSTSQGLELQAGDPTQGFLQARQALYQLSHTPNHHSLF